jgi:hypothetical protein
MLYVKHYHLLHSVVLQRSAVYTTAIYYDLGTLLVAKISLYLNLLQAQDISDFCLQGDRQLHIYPISAWEELLCIGVEEVTRHWNAQFM